jgi:RNA polymerase sigma factor for flagellar operon FliA
MEGKDIPSEAELTPNASSEASAETQPLIGEAQLWENWRLEQDVKCREQLVLHYLPYARVVAASYFGRRFNDEIEFVDYLQLASVGLLESIDRFDPSVGVQFKTFAARRMQGAILNGIEKITEKQQQIAFRKQIQVDRRESLKHDEKTAKKPADKPEQLFKYLADVGIGLALAYLLDGTGMIDAPEEAIDQNQHYKQIELKQLQQRIRGLVNDLSPQERTIVRYYYLQEMPFSEIAEMLGLTKGRIAQIHRQALDRLREMLQKRSNLDISL